MIAANMRLVTDDLCAGSVLATVYVRIFSPSPHPFVTNMQLATRRLIQAGVENRWCNGDCEVESGESWQQIMDGTNQEEGIWVNRSGLAGQAGSVLEPQRVSHGKDQPKNYAVGEEGNATSSA